MWKFKKIFDEIVTLHCSPESITLYTIKNYHDARNRFAGTATKKILLTHNEYDEGRMLNPTRIAKHITHWMTFTKKKRTPLVIILSGHYIKEHVVVAPSAFFPETAIQKPKRLVTESCYLYPKEDGSCVFYACAIERATILQYQLMAITHNINLQAITTPAIAYLNLYRASTGNAFSHHALGQILNKNNNDVYALAQDPSIVSGILANDYSAQSAEQKNELLIAVGASAIL